MARLPGRTLTLAAALMVCAPGCYMQGTTGIAMEPTQPDAEHLAAPIQIHVGMHDGDDLGFGANLRTRFGPSLVHFGLGGEAIFVSEEDFYGRIALSLFTIESADGALSLGAFTPYIEGGYIFYLDREDWERDGIGVSVSVAADYTLRFTGADSAPYVMVLVGLWTTLSGRL